MIELGKNKTWVEAELERRTTPTSVSGCLPEMLEKTRSQFGRPKCVGALSEVIASRSAPTSWTCRMETE